MRACVCRPAAWREPLEALGAVADEPFTLALLSDGSPTGRWSYLMHRPVALLASLEGLIDALAAGAGPEPVFGEDHPPFRGGVAGLASYEWSAALEPAAPQARTDAWPDLACGLYDSLLAFDHHRRRVWAVGRGPDEAAADARAEAAAALLAAPATTRPPLIPTAFVEAGTSLAHQAAVAEVVEAIAAGEIFQANIARRWTGRLASGQAPIDALAALMAKSPAPFAGYLKLDGLAVVSNSPERFLRVSPAGRVVAQPIKGTLPRGGTPDEDRALAEALLASAKDRAENLMIVDLMRNDLARACRPGTVKVEAFCALESYTNVHHLVSTITGRLASDATALDLFAGAFPAGSITGAPKLQAMTVIARFEPPRGPYCGSLFWAGFDGGFDSSVLIRTIAFEQGGAGDWRFETRAGGGITADSDPVAEDAEAVTKIAAIRSALAAP